MVSYSSSNPGLHFASLRDSAKKVVEALPFNGLEIGIVLKTVSKKVKTHPWSKPQAIPLL